MYISDMEQVKGVSIMTVSDYAAKKDISVQAVYQKIKRGNLESKKIGKVVFVVL